MTNTTSTIRRSTYISPRRFAVLRFKNVWRRRLQRNAWWLHGVAGLIACTTIVAACGAMILDLAWH